MRILILLAMIVYLPIFGEEKRDKSLTEELKGYQTSFIFL